MMLLTILFALVILLLVGIGFGAGYALFKNPPIIRAEIVYPAPNVSKQIVVPDAVTREPIPQDILDYIDQESEEHARTTRRARARNLRAELGGWKEAFSQLQREDNLG